MSLGTLGSEATRTLADTVLLTAASSSGAATWHLAPAGKEHP